MNGMWNRRPGQKKKKKGNKGCLFIVFGTVVVMVALFAFIFLTGQLTRVTVSHQLGDRMAYALMTASTPCIVVSFILMEAILVLQFLPSEEDYKDDANTPELLNHKKTALGKKSTIHIISAVIGLGVIACSFISANTYTTVSDEGIAKHFFKDTRVYEWKQVSAYTVDCDDDKGLSVTFTMRDGRQIEILQNTMSASQPFLTKYDATPEEAKLAFSLEIDQKMADLQIPRNVKHMERAVNFYRSDMPELWKYVSVLIGYRDIIPEEDETVTETESLTDTAPETTIPDTTPAITE